VSARAGDRLQARALLLDEGTRSETAVIVVYCAVRPRSLAFTEPTEVTTVASPARMLLSREAISSERRSRWAPRQPGAQPPPRWPPLGPNIYGRRRRRTSGKPHSSWRPSHDPEVDSSGLARIRPTWPTGGRPSEIRTGRTTDPGDSERSETEDSVPRIA